jgi:hypothetical protein
MSIPYVNGSRRARRPEDGGEPVLDRPRSRDPDWPRSDDSGPARGWAATEWTSCTTPSTRASSPPRRAGRVGDGVTVALREAAGARPGTAGVMAAS